MLHTTKVPQIIDVVIPFVTLVSAKRLGKESCP